MGDWGVGMPAAIKVGWFGRVVDEFFGHVPYLVGSATRTTNWRDVDVRLILPDQEFDALFGELTRPRCISLKWNAACLAFTALGKDITGLPIDFQIDRQTEANEEYDGPRHALHDHLIAKGFPELSSAAASGEPSAP